MSKKTIMLSLFVALLLTGCNTGSVPEPTEESVVEVVEEVVPESIVPEYYQLIVDAYLAAIDSGEITSEQKKYVNPYAVKSYQFKSDSRLGAVTYDVDGNGMEELLMGLETDGTFAVCDIWTSDGNEAISLTRNTIAGLNLCEEWHGLKGEYYEVKATICNDGAISITGSDYLAAYISENGKDLEIVAWDDHEKHDVISKEFEDGELVDLKALEWEIIADASKPENSKDPYFKWERFVYCFDFRELIGDENSQYDLEYVIYDLDQDGTPELLLQTPAGEPFYNTWLFAFDGDDIVLVNSDYGYGQYRYSPKAALVIGSSSFKPFQGAGESLFYQYSDQTLAHIFTIINDEENWYYVENDQREPLDIATKDTYFDDAIMFDWKMIGDFDDSSEINSEDDADYESDEWKEAYLNYIYENGFVTDSFGDLVDTYKLVDVNGDSIPELYVSYGSTAAGDVLCSYYNGELMELPMWVGGFSYLEGENLFGVRGGHMDVYFDEIYTMEDGHFVILHEGNFGAIDNANVQYDSDGRPIYAYNWDGEEVANEEEYANRVNKEYDLDRASRPFDDAEFNYDTGRYEGNGLCDYNEIIEAINSR